MQNYWLIVVEQGSDKQQYQVHQKATAALLMDLWMRRLLEPGPAPASAYLYWMDENETKHLQIEMRFPARQLTGMSGKLPDAQDTHGRQ